MVQLPALTEVSAVVEEVEHRCRQSWELNIRVGAELPDAVAYCKRHDLTRLAIDLAIEHHRSLVRLVYAGELGSGAALLRPLLEASTSAFWLLYAASDNQILRLPEDPTIEASSDDIPMLGEMAFALQPLFPKIAAIAEGLSRKGSGSARWLHKYTHGGTPQLMRRDRANSWTSSEALLTLRRSDIFLIVGASVEAALQPDSSFADFIYSQRDRVGEEIMDALGAPPIPTQPRHPAPPTACIGPAMF